jgi:hypothetical protein
VALTFIASRFGLDDFLAGPRRGKLENTRSEEVVVSRSVATRFKVLKHASLIPVVPAQSNGDALHGFALRNRKLFRKL